MKNKVHRRNSLEEPHSEQLTGSAESKMAATRQSRVLISEIRVLKTSKNTQLDKMKAEIKEIGDRVIDLEIQVEAKLI